MFKALKKRFIILNMTMISIVMIIAFSSIYIITINNVNNQNTLKLDEISSNTLNYLKNNNYYENNSFKVFITDDLSSSDNIEYLSILIDSKDKPIVDSTLNSNTQVLLNKLIGLALEEDNDQSKIEFNKRQFIFSIKALYVKVPTNEILDDKLIIETVRQITFLDITDSQIMLKQLLFTFIFIGLFMLVIIYGISVYFARRSVAPVELAYFKQKQFIADASHELKTPIASIGANIDAIISNPNETIVSQNKWINYIKAETERMGKLVGDLLYLAKTDNIINNDEKSSFNLSEVINNVILTMEVVAYEKGIQVNQYIDENINICADIEKIEQVIIILFDNSIKYVNQNGIIDITLSQNKHHVIFSITNTGDGIESQHIPKIFDRFYRIDPSRQHDGSYGLGLSIAKAIINNMKGEINVSSVLGESTTFNVIINK